MADALAEKGYNGKLLNVNLTTGEITVETPDDSLYRQYLGGYGICMDRDAKGRVQNWGPDVVPKEWNQSGVDVQTIHARALL